MASCEARENHGFVVSRRFGMSMGRLNPRCDHTRARCPRRGHRSQSIVEPLE
jgi:hypothetical protein